MAVAEGAAPVRRARGSWSMVAAQELRDLWLGGRGLVLSFASSLLLSVIAYLVASEKMRGPLDRLRAWLDANNSAVMGVLILVIGVLLIGKGISGLSA